MQSLRIEKAFPLYGNDLHEGVTPFHAGLDRWIAFDKREFVGRAALLRVQETGIQERWVGLALESSSPAAPGDPIYSVGDIASFRAKKLSGGEAGEEEEGVLPGERIGHVTASALGHSLGKTLAMAYVRTTHAWPGSKLVVISNGRPVVAVVSQTPFFDPSGARMRARASAGPERIQATGGASSMATPLTVAHAPPTPTTAPRPPARNRKGARAK
jgi:aminomethyltransferase